MSETVDVWCFVFPDGTTYWQEDEPELTPQRFVDNWKAALNQDDRAEYESNGVFGGFVKLRMLRRDYRAIPATVASYCIAHGVFGMDQQTMPPDGMTE